MNYFIQLKTILWNTTDSVLCRRGLRIQCKYYTTESSGSFLEDNGVCGFKLNDDATESSDFVTLLRSQKRWWQWRRPWFFVLTTGSVFLININYLRRTAKVMFSSLLVCQLVCLFVCVSVDNIAEKQVNRCSWNFQDMSATIQGTIWKFGGVSPLTPWVMGVFYCVFKEIRVC